MHWPKHKKISVQSKSFGILFIVAFLGTYIAYVYDKQTAQNLASNSASQNQDSYSQPKPTQENIPEKTIDTSDWKTYNNAKWGLSFKLPKDWRVKTEKTTEGFSLLEIDPGAKYYNMNIYASKKSFFSLDGLPVKRETINGMYAVNVSNLLYGIKNEASYFTFDIGISLKFKDEFKALVHTVELSSVE